MKNIRDYINEENVIKDEIYKIFENSLTCSICSDIFINPMMCMNCQNVYCKACIDDWKKKSIKCPNRCENPNYNKSISTSEMLSKLKFICNKCDNVINYDDMKNHSLTDCSKKKKIEELPKSKTAENKNINKINSKLKNLNDNY